MDGIRPLFTVGKSFSLLLLILLQTSTEAQICSVADSYVSVAENNAVGVVVETITTQPGVTLEFSPPPANPDYPFILDGNNLNEFVLRSNTDPTILVNARLDYDKVKNVELILTVQDSKLPPEDTVRSATATITVTILDEDNRPPWFQPCTPTEIGSSMICQSPVYTGRVDLNEQETGVLPLEPGPLYAIDGDYGIKEEIVYSILSGNEDGLFAIDPNTGNITMLKAADVLGTISLSVLAAQAINSYQYATTTVTISIQVKSLHPPVFQKTLYEGLATSSGTMVMDRTNKDQPLRILATDADYAATGGLNPHITYSISGSSDFSLIDGYLFMTKDLPESTLTLEVVAKDTTNDETDKSQLSLEVKTGLTTTKLPQSTTDFITTTPTEKFTTDDKITGSAVSTISNTVPTVPTGGTSSTTDPDGESPTTRDQPVTTPAGENDVVGMAVIGAVLGALLLIALVIIGVLICRLRKGKADWKKIYEASMFRSSLGQGSGGHKEGIQYTNEAFQKDEDGSSLGSGGPERESVIASKAPPQTSWNIEREEAIMKSSAPLHDLLPDNSSDTSSEKSDSENDVKPILTKERRVEEGYKSVWFKEDIDPDAKEEVVIIPDSREDDSEEEDEEPSRSSREDDEDNNPLGKKIFFADSDLDSGIEVKTENPPQDSDSDESMDHAL
ncbi:cadherin-related family member 5-like [Acanthochromis polyacanthus]|uniref:cadherin-related family member 5-like n=1 Tax=Acanthochromis polyacanthus TaxID=80966 RepID=UPI002234E8E7|nr:cadherin-related family member 5-like [Acanthochromis polyacanthus]